MGRTPYAVTVAQPLLFKNSSEPFLYECPDCAGALDTIPETAQGEEDGSPVSALPKNPTDDPDAEADVIDTGDGHLSRTCWSRCRSTNVIGTLANGEETKWLEEQVLKQKCSACYWFCDDWHLKGWSCQRSACPRCRGKQRSRTRRTTHRMA